MSRSAQSRGASRRGQALVEFSLVIGLFMLVVGGVVQFGLIIWSQNTVTQVARDTARWAATQSTSPCDSAGSRSAVAAEAGTLAWRLNLLAYRAGTWTTASSVATTGQEGVGADWGVGSDTTQWPVPPGLPLFPSDCPPTDNQTPWFLQVRVNHVIPIFFPGLQIIAPPCASQGFCISSTAEIRMEPKAP